MDGYTYLTGLGIVMLILSVIFYFIGMRLPK